MFSSFPLTKQLKLVILLQWNGSKTLVLWNNAFAGPRTKYPMKFKVKEKWYNERAKAYHSLHR